MLENATRICEADFGNLLLYEGNAFRIAARIAAPHGAAPAWAELQRGDPTVHPHPKDALARVVRTKRLQHVADLRTEEAYVEGDRSVVGLADVAGARTVLVVPMLKENELIGVLAIYRKEVRPFTEKQIELVQSFADQAVIAIENARLLNELRRRTDDLSQALEHQTATGEILASIGGAITDAKPVFDAIVRNLRRLFGTRLAMVQILKDGMVHLAAAGHEQEFEKLVAQFPRPLDESTGSGGVMLSKQAVQFAPVAGNPAVPVVTQQFARELGFNAVIYAPMIREGMVIGAIGAARHEPKPFDDKQVALIKAFADQAVIAIENVRLFDEVQARTRELTEALEQQTATSEVLKVISRSPTNIQPVLDAVGENAARLCQANNAVIFRLEDGLLRQVADYGQIPTSSHPSEGLPVNRDTVTGRAVFERRTLHIHDLSTEDREFPEGSQHARLDGHRTTLATPLLREGVPVGAILIRRMEVRPFSQKQIELITTFADQAAIAIENVRLFDAEQQRTRELSEALEQQTATAEVLGVISSSPSELEPVFDAILENAVRICEARFGNLLLYEGNAFRVAAIHGAPPAWNELLRRDPVIRFGPRSPLARVAATRQLQHFADIRMHEAYLERERAVVAFVEMSGARTVLVVPMLKEQELVGAVAVYRQEVRPFTDKHIELVSNFAKQAVIAIENTRLLNELRQRTDDLSESLEQQTATSEVLQVISTSPGELQPVFACHGGESGAHLRGQVRQFVSVRATRLSSRLCHRRAVRLFGVVAAGINDYPKRPSRRPAGQTRQNQSSYPHRRSNGGARLHRARPEDPPPSRIRRNTDHSVRADAQGGRADRRYRDLPSGGSAVHG